MANNITLFRWIYTYVSNTYFQFSGVFSDFIIILHSFLKESVNGIDCLYDSHIQR